MPPKKSVRASVKAKTSVLSSVAVQVALVVGGASILAAAAAFVSIKASRTQLTVSVVSTGRNPIVASVGDRNVATFSLAFKAAAKAVSLNALALTVITDNDGEFKKNVTDDLSASQVLADCRLLDGKKVVGQASAADPLAFSVNAFVISARASRRLNVVCDLVKQPSAGNDADIFALGLAKGTDVTATFPGPNGTAVSPSAISFGAAASGLNMKGQTWSVLVKPAVVAVVPTPTPAQNTYCPDADTDGYPLGGTSCVQAAAASVGQMVPRQDGKLDCDDTNANVHPDKIEIVGNGKDDDCDANTLDQGPAAATPVVTAALASGSPSGAGIPSLAELFRFNVIVDQAADVNLHGFTFHLLSTDTAGSGWNSCDKLGSTSKWGLRNASDMGTRVEDAADWSFFQADGTPCAAGKELAYATVDFTAAGDRDPKFVGAGNTNAYLLRVDTSGASATNDDIVRIDMPAVSAFQGIGSALRSIRWSPAFPPTAPVSDAVRNLPVMGGTVVY